MTKIANILSLFMEVSFTSIPGSPHLQNIPYGRLMQKQVYAICLTFLFIGIASKMQVGLIFTAQRYKMIN